jgi:hypothetical protein
MAVALNTLVEEAERYLGSAKIQDQHQVGFGLDRRVQQRLARRDAADDPHHLIGHGQGGVGTKAHDIFTLPLCREHHNELHADPLAFEEKHGSQVDLIFRFLDHAFATGVLG